MQFQDFDLCPHNILTNHVSLELSIFISLYKILLNYFWLSTHC